MDGQNSSGSSYRKQSGTRPGDGRDAFSRGKQQEPADIILNFHSSWSPGRVHPSTRTAKFSCGMGTAIALARHSVSFSRRFLFWSPIMRVFSAAELGKGSPDDRRLAKELTSFLNLSLPIRQSSLRLPRASSKNDSARLIGVQGK